jgi:hypothetical protein
MPAHACSELYICRICYQGNGTVRHMQAGKEEDLCHTVRRSGLHGAKAENSLARVIPRH